MRGSLSIIYLLAILFMGCNKVEIIVEDYIDFPDQDLYFTSNSASRSINFETSSDWVLYFEDGNSWISVNPVRGEMGKASVNLDVNSNSDIYDRSGHIVILSGNAKHRFKVVQGSKESLFLRDDSYEISMGGGVIEIPVLSNVNYSVELTPELQGWVTLDQTKSLVRDVIRVSVEKNENRDICARSGLINVKANNKNYSIRINQVAIGYGYFFLDQENTLRNKVSPQKAKTIKKLIIDNTIGKDDFMYIQECFENLNFVDISRTGLNVLPDYAFSYSEYYASYLPIKEIILPETLVELGDGSLGCFYLEKCDIPRTVQKIGKRAFWYSGMEDINLPVNISVIEEETFLRCRNLKRIELSNDIVEIQKGAFNSCYSLEMITIPEKIDVLNEDTFQNCKVLREVIFQGDKVRAISDGCFKNCSSLAIIKPPDFLSTIGYETFFGCGSLVSFDFPKSLGVIESYAFCGTGIKSIYINNIIRIGEEIFSNCPELSDVFLEEGIKIIPNGIFSGCHSLKSITLPSTTEIIERKAFSNSGLMEIDLPESITRIELNAFGDTKLKRIIIPSSVSYIPETLFIRCEELEEIIIYGNIESVGNYAFFGCKGLKLIQCMATEPPIIYHEVFSYVSEDCVIKVPSESVSNYKDADGWSRFKNIIGI